MPCRIHAALGVLICLVVTHGRSQRPFLTEENQRVALLQEQGRYREAEALFSADLKQAERLPPGDPAIANTMNNLALVYQELGKIVEAERLYRRAIARYGEIYGSDSPELTKPLQNLTSLYLEQGQHGKAERSLRRLLALCPDASGRDPVDSIRTLQLQALSMQDMHRYRDAERLYRQALSVGENPTGDRIDRATAAVLNNLARLYIETGRPGEAVVPLQQALRTLEKLSRDNHPDLVKPMANLALVYATLHRPLEAEPLITRALAIEEAEVGIQSRTYGLLLFDYALVLRQMHRRSEAKDCERRAKDILAIVAARTGAGRTVDIQDLVSRPPGR